MLLSPVGFKEKVSLLDMVSRSFFQGTSANGGLV